MTRLLRIEMCDECPHALAGLACDSADAGGTVPFTVYTSAGIREYRRFHSYPLIPAWCPLEQDGPDYDGRRSS